MSILTLNWHLSTEGLCCVNQFLAMFQIMSSPENTGKPKWIKLKHIFVGWAHLINQHRDIIKF